jgi:hypothetical protein
MRQSAGELDIRLGVVDVLSMMIPLFGKPILAMHLVVVNTYQLKF